MNNLAYCYQLIPNYKKVSEIKAFLQDTYWNNDIWVLKDSFFDEFRPNIQYVHWGNINFSEYPELLNLEIKYFLACKILSFQLSLSTIDKSYRFANKSFVKFLNSYYPEVTSFSQIDIETMKKPWLEYTQKYHKGAKKDSYLAQIYRLYMFYSDFYDTREEYEKDIWDGRKIPSVKIAVNTANYWVNFTSIPKEFRDFVKRYMKLCLTVNSMSQCRLELDSISYFLKFINEKEPAWTNLNLLSRHHVEEFIFQYISTHTEKTRRMLDRLICIRRFLFRIQEFDYKEAPHNPAPKLFYYEDIPSFQNLPPKQERIKYIPENVMFQLKEHLGDLTPSEYIPVVILLIASGWRASDILNLKYDDCLEHTSQGWYLKGDILKTNTKDHRIPITDEVRILVESVAQVVQEKSTPTNNPLHLLFNRFHGSRMGRSPDNRRISEALDRLAKKHNITDDQGNIYHFNLHAFRHTKGVELINNGMNLVHVQKWMAHMTPEMTLVYAKILDTTLRKSWESIAKQGVFRITPTGNIEKFDISDIDNEDLIEWEYIRHNLDAVKMPLGFCMKPKKQECFSQLNPCLTCRNLCTTPDFLPQFEIEIEETKLLIERGKIQGRQVWVEKNQHLLDRYEEIVSILKNGNIRHLAGKKGREYIGKERDNV